MEKRINLSFMKSGKDCFINVKDLVDFMEVLKDDNKLDPEVYSSVKEQFTKFSNK